MEFNLRRQANCFVFFFMVGPTASLPRVACLSPSLTSASFTDVPAVVSFVGFQVGGALLTLLRV